MFVVQSGHVTYKEMQCLFCRYMDFPSPYKEKKHVNFHKSVAEILYPWKHILLDLLILTRHQQLTIFFFF